MRHRIVNLTLACVLACASGAAFARLYVGSQVGYADGRPDAGQIDNDLVNNLGFFSASTNVDKGDGAWRVFAGYQILPWLAVEGLMSTSARRSGRASSSLPARWMFPCAPPRGRSASPRATSSYPSGGAIGRLSAAWTETKSSVSASGFAEVAGEPKARRTVPAYAAGVEYAFSPRVFARLEYEGMSDVSSDELRRQVRHQHDQHRHSLSVLDVRYRAAQR